MQAQLLEATPIKQGNKINWKLCHDRGGGNKPCGDQPGNYPAVDVENKADVPFKITIVGDTTGLGIKYAPDPIWAQWATTKPAAGWNTKPSGADVDQLVNIQGAGTTVLQFRDTNSKAGDIKYQLNFVSSTQPSLKVAPLDPDIRNGGTNIPPPPPPPPGYGLIDSNTSLVVALLLAFVVGFLVAGLLFRWGRTRG